MIFHQIYFIDKKNYIDYSKTVEYNRKQFREFTSNRMLLERSSLVFQLGNRSFKIIKTRVDLDESITPYMCKSISDIKEFIKYNQRLEMLVETKITLHKSFEEMVIEKLNSYILKRYSSQDFVMLCKTSKDSLV